MNKTSRSREPQRSAEESRFFGVVLAGMATTLAAAVALSFVVGAHLPPQIQWRASDALLGLVVAAPLCGFLYFLMASQNEKVAAFRESQIDLFEQVGFRFTPSRILLMSVGAGVSEELLFRGVLQTWAAAHMPIAAAIILPSILFGALHARNLAYGVIAGVVGVYFGIVFWASGNLLVPIVAHTIYDIVALEVTRREIDARKRDFTGEAPSQEAPPSPDSRDRPES